jgi:uncharacterized protein YoxC
MTATVSVLATSGASDAAAVIVSVVAVVAAIGMIVAVVALTRTLTSIRLAVEELRRESLPVVKDLHTTIQRANGELERVDGLLDSAQSVTSTVDSVSRLAFLAVGNPVIKAAAAASGIARAARSLRRRSRAK